MTIFQLRTPRASRNTGAPRLPRVLKLTVPALAASVMTATVAAAETARAAAMPPDEAATLLPPVEVVASPLTTPLVVVTDPKTPRQPLPASDGADYLKTIPGFTSIRSGGTNGDPVLRGMFGSRLNILANGMPTLGACPNRMDAPTSYIAPESFDKVTVVKGPQTVLYGPGASAGTVLFERVTPRFDKPGMRFDGSVVGGSFGRNDQNVDVTAGTPDVYGRVTANHAHAQDYKDGNGNVVPSQWDKWNADAALGWTPDDHTRVELTAGTGDGYAKYAGRGMDGAHFRRETFGLSFDKRHIGDMLDRVEARVYYNEADHVMDNYTLRQPDPASSMPMRMAAEVRRRTFGARAAATFRFGDDFKLVTGVDAQTNRLDSRSAMGRQNYGDQPWNAQATMWNAGAFGELTWYASDASRVIGGARIDYASARDKRPATSGMMMSRPNPTFDDDRARVLPSGFVRYERDLASLPVTWYAGIGHAERYPDYWELFSANRGPAGALNAFSAVQPEKTTQLDIGAQYKSERLDAWVSAYAGYVQDFILFNYAAGMMGPTTQATNVNAQVMGGEAGVAWRPLAPLRVETSIAYAWGRNATSGDPLPQMPPLEARFGLEYTRGAWSAGGLWRVVAPQHRYALNEGNVVGKDFGPSAGFGVLSLHAQYNVSKTVQISVGVDNVLNKAYTEHLNLAGNAGFGYPANAPVMEPGRTAWVRVSAKL
ncbi:TonB-dependent copper receptor [Burkholderia pseudomultivorans]|uniref:TonB-dependent copper receptor n=1 Tax=Burkholderia pseudomultivorans TaxID=1207504 RepID=A0A6P2H3K0_9BURK|nr:TonB-dependent copper receptor [Burkholderia pseudomultivorans]MDR8732239.1 Vitamin B12 transporter BtuB [Burkholderia pseudomultivorans]MDR8734541.1 Vitamin B12 transporter BtuB [Burkholderia pseudomultivorans]MDR8739281.1 Vitamin B12 transporter BtuB [Burkholderia pseudomultivorans]MDR8755689.1 Vitamin B12 transporter BtuB [Burkholderia pseudomultivorans]MDR8775491.1 Vitamin B12 transporter BtuB [Burkholderia pseudomultivorans]